MNSIVLKRIGPDELPRVVKLRLHLWKRTGKIRSDIEYSEMFERNSDYFTERFAADKAVVYVYENTENSEWVSIGIGVIIDKPPVNLDDGGGEGYICNVYTDENCRKRGYAFNIIKKIMEYFASKGVGRAVLTANEESLNLYTACGFAVNPLHLEKLVER